AAEPGVVVPAAAPEDPVRALLRTRGVAYLPRRILPVPVAAPLPDVAVHVVQPQRIRRVRADSTRLFQVRALGRAAIRIIAVEIGLTGGRRRAVADTEGSGRRAPSPTGILPLRLRRQAVQEFSSRFFLGQLPGKGVGLFPAHILH